MDVARAYFDKHIAAKDSRLQWTMYRQDLAAWWEAYTAEGHHSSSEDAPVPDSRAMAIATHFLQGLALHDWAHVQHFLHGATPRQQHFISSCGDFYIASSPCSRQCIEAQV